MQEKSWTIGELFEATDQDKKGYITMSDFEHILTDGGKRADMESGEIAYLLRLYKWNVDGQSLDPNTRITF